ncbi:MAG: ribose 5-phosphate isomerase B [Planctomycetota bacterium]|jgi:ribose 5-phosphate isomerase B
MKIALGSDHAGPDVKSRIAEALREAGHEVLDMGTEGTASVDYPDFASSVARAVASGEAERGVLVCGTGIGMAMAANKVKGIRAAVCHDEYTVRMTRRHNDANVLCIGARVLPAARIVDLTQLFLSEPFEGGRHAGRVEKIMALEKEE